MSKVYTEADLAAAWASGYWNGTTHVGPLNDAAVEAKNPYKKESGLDTSAKKSVQTAEESP